MLSTFCIAVRAEIVAAVYFIGWANKILPLLEFLLFSK